VKRPEGRKRRPIKRNEGRYLNLQGKKRRTSVTEGEKTCRGPGIGIMDLSTMPFENFWKKDSTTSREKRIEEREEC